MYQHTAQPNLPSQQTRRHQQKKRWHQYIVMTKLDLQNLSKEELIEIIQGTPKRPTRTTPAVPKTLTNDVRDLNLDTPFEPETVTRDSPKKKASLNEFRRSELAIGTFHSLFRTRIQNTESVNASIRIRVSIEDEQTRDVLNKKYGPYQKQMPIALKEVDVYKYLLFVLLDSRTNYTWRSMRVVTELPYKMDSKLPSFFLNTHNE